MKGRRRLVGKVAMSEQNPEEGSTALPSAPLETPPTRLPEHETAPPVSLPASGTCHGGPEGPTIPGYQILGILGHGGMGVVYQARQLSLNRVIALKCIQTSPFAGRGHVAQVLARFRLEAEAVARLHHPNII